ncbi:PREDICTED: uncharacterized protein LOC105575086 [Cercocebus atys]|uniref:uncharacterized protein LOC105575086 n=1 Tax=Cercocebus atys TaxID=9531 RepID=UPI0005F57687|nr:PREDICTED: uncharacterized protein LOC105575086 [Cercocebus atys]
MSGRSCRQLRIWNTALRYRASLWICSSDRRGSSCTTHLTLFFPIAKVTQQLLKATFPAVLGSLHIFDALGVRLRCLDPVPASFTLHLPLWSFPRFYSPPLLFQRPSCPCASPAPAPLLPQRQAFSSSSPGFISAAGIAPPSGGAPPADAEVAPSCDVPPHPFQRRALLAAVGILMASPGMASAVETYVTKARPSHGAPSNNHSASG